MGKHFLFFLSVCVTCSHAFSCPPNNNPPQQQRQRGKRPLVQWIGGFKKHNNSRQHASTLSSFTPSADDTTTTTTSPLAFTEQSTREEDASLPDSVHLQLNEKSTENTNKRPPATSVKVHTYRDPVTQQTWTALNTTQQKFKAYLLYCGVVKRRNKQIIDTEILTDKHNDLRLEWRKLWKERRLVTDRTELLTVYPSESSRSLSRGGRRGGFGDLLSLYTDRLVAIWRDEREEPLMEWLVAHCPTTALLLPPAFGRLQPKEKLATLKTFLEWFRAEFPYFYDRCAVCGASIKEEGARQENADEDDDDNHTFVGYIFPSATELEGKASRTELYQCHKCKSFTRFPRYNSARYVLDNRRGRCGEYSMLLYRFLRTLGHECRWVVDWADHVWAEIRLDNRWVHLDPCEAALDHNLLYQEWGKKQTFVLGFCLPASSSSSFKYPLIEDITHHYTSDAKSEILNRREESDEEVKAAIEKAAAGLRSRLLQKE